MTSITSSRPRNADGLTVLELLLATVLLLLVVAFLMSALHMASRGARRAEWIAQSERELEAFHHLLSAELRRANHLISMDASRTQVHDPRFSGVWVIEEGRGVGFRVFESDQPVEDPEELDPEALRQDRVFFVLRDRELLYLRHGQLEPDVVRVLLSDVTSLSFRQTSRYERTGPLSGALTVELEILARKSAGRISRTWNFATSVPVLHASTPPSDVDWIPAPVLDATRAGP